MSNHTVEVSARRGDELSGQLAFYYNGQDGMKHYAQLSPQQARELALALNEAADVMDNVPPQGFRKKFAVSEGYRT